MPELDGIETTLRIQSLYENEEFLEEQDPPVVIMVSAYRQEYIVDTAKKAGIELFLQKPVDPSTLFDVLIKVLMRQERKVSRPLTYKERTVELKKLLATRAGSQLLLVEDNRLNQQILFGLLDGLDFNIDVAENGKQALKIIEKNNYDLVLMDMQMPVMDGIEASEIIRETDNKTPIIALTANVLPEQVKQAMDAGMNHHLGKPINVEELYRAILKYVPAKQTNIPSNSSVADSDQILPDIPEINLDAGLRHFANNKVLFLKVLKDFIKQYQTLTFDTVDEADRPRLVHTLKGLTGNLGINNVYGLLSEYEVAPSEDKLAVIETVLAKTLISISQHLPAESKKTNRY